MSTRRSGIIHAAALAALICLASASAQTQANTQGQTRQRRTAPATARQVQPPRTARRPAPDSSQAAPRRDPTVENADLAITARVTARELRFEKVPDPKVEFTGRPRRETLWESERENLPPQVRPGETYRDIGIRLRITSVFADIERIVAEALGEIPPGDDPQPERDPRQQNEPQQNTPPVQEEQYVAAQDSPAANQPAPRQTAAAPALRSTLTSPATAPATDKTTRQRRGATRKERER